MQPDDRIDDTVDDQLDDQFDDQFDDAGDDTGDGRDGEGPRRSHGPVGTAIGAAMLGLEQVIFGKQREEAPIVITASGEPGDVDTDGIVIRLDDDADIVAPPLPPTPPVVAPRRRRRLW